MSVEQLARLIADAASKSDAAHWPEAVAIALGPVIADAKAEALRDAAKAYSGEPEGTTSNAHVRWWLNVRAEKISA